MKKDREDQRKQINDIVSVVKIVALLISGSVVFGRIFMKDEMSYEYYSLVFVMLAILLLSLIYCIWAFWTIKKIKVKNMEIIYKAENCMFIFMFFIVVILSGGYVSKYKFLFLFIVITATIQLGMKHGVIVASISSIIILTIDIIGTSNLPINEYFQNDLILSGVFLLTAWPLGVYTKIQKEYINMLEDLANKDGLTGVCNHRYFYDVLEREVSKSKENNKPVSMIFIDLDYFKHYNDLYGHQKGDKVLKELGELLRDNCRKDDIVARYGGEEFALLLPNTCEFDAVNIAERIRYKIEEKPFDGEENQPNNKITASIGVSVYPDKANSAIELIKSADDALYRAKFFNKNRVETYTSILDDLKNDIEEEHIDLVTSIKTLISVINAKDKYTYGHVERVVTYCRLFAENLNLNEKDRKTLIYGAYMHDIGKINISEGILNKKMPLNNEEWNILKEHPVNGVEIIKSVESLNYIAPLILHHHERYDGKGYPKNLKGEDIPYLSRVLTVIDSFDAMTSHRPYNVRKTFEEAIEELYKCSGTQFDPKIVEIFVEVIEKNKNKLGQ